MGVCNLVNCAKEGIINNMESSSSLPCEDIVWRGNGQSEVTLFFGLGVLYNNNNN